MQYNIKAKPTIYKGNKYRSKLEARWACFFDLIGWQYEYEPCEFDGWTPDFIVYGSSGRVIYFEVKPYIDDNIIEDYLKRLRKLQLKANVILLSNEFEQCKNYGCGVSAGTQLNWIIDGDIRVESFPVHWKDGQTGRSTEYDIGSLYFLFDGLLWHDGYNRKQFIMEDSIEHRLIYNLWVDAGNLTSYKYGRVG